INEFKNTYLFVRQQEGKRRKREVSYDIDILKSDHRVDWVENLTPLKRKTRDEKLTNQSNNEHYKKQWHFRKDQENRLVFENMKVKEAWKLGFTGKGVVVSVVDDALAAGIIALTLEAKDVQHLIVNTSDFKPLNGTEWKRNGAGLMYNSQFGFGLIDAEAMVKAALSWVNVPPKTNCYTPIQKSFQQHIPIGKSVIVDFDSNGCKGSLNEINSLEHVQVFLSISYFWRGDLEISLTSPSGNLKSFFIFFLRSHLNLTI
ncbi:Neuroendocrine convertase 1-like protein, partial [Dinothrombium tinctorium]